MGIEFGTGEGHKGKRTPSEFNIYVGSVLKGREYPTPPVGMGGRRDIRIQTAFTTAAHSYKLSRWILKFMQDRPTSGLSANDLQAAIAKEGFTVPPVWEIEMVLKELFKQKQVSKPFGDSPQPASTIYQWGRRPK